MTRNLIARTIDHWENLDSEELRVLLEFLLLHWTVDKRVLFLEKHPMIAVKLNPGLDEERLAHIVELLKNPTIK